MRFGKLYYINTRRLQNLEPKLSFKARWNYIVNLVRITGNKQF